MTRRWLLLTLMLASCTHELDLGAGAPPERLRPGTPELTVGFLWRSTEGQIPLRPMGGWCGSTVCLLAVCGGLLGGEERVFVHRYARPSGELLDAAPIELPFADGCWWDFDFGVRGASSGDDFFLAVYGLGAAVSGADGSVRSYDLPDGLEEPDGIVADENHWIMAGYDADARAVRVMSMPRDGGAWTELATDPLPVPPSRLHAVDTGTGRFLVWSDGAECVWFVPITGGLARCVATGEVEAAVGVDGVIAMAVRSFTDHTIRIGALSPAAGRFEETATSDNSYKRFLSLGTSGYLELAGSGGQQVTRRHPDGRGVEAPAVIEIDLSSTVLPLSQDRLLVLDPIGPGHLAQRFLTYR